MTGRLCSGVIQVVERVRVLPGDQTAVVKCECLIGFGRVMWCSRGSFLAIEVEEENVPWAMAGSNTTLFLTNIDPINLAVGSVLCTPSNLIPLATTFTARIIIFEVQVPITAGASVRNVSIFVLVVSDVVQVELFHHSRDVPATISSLLTTLDRATGAVFKKKPRYVLILLFAFEFHADSFVC